MMIPDLFYPASASTFASLSTLGPFARTLPFIQREPKSKTIVGALNLFVPVVAILSSFDMMPAKNYDFNYVYLVLTRKFSQIPLEEDYWELSLRRR